ncbi:unnamed protein product [Gadus morhua 'NCC']
MPIRGLRDVHHQHSERVEPVVRKRAHMKERIHDLIEHIRVVRKHQMAEQGFTDTGEANDSWAPDVFEVCQAGWECLVDSLRSEVR